MAFLDGQAQTIVSAASPTAPTIKLREALSPVGLAHPITQPTFGATIAFDLSASSTLLVIATAATNITISAPTNVPNLSGQNIEIIISNQSGGAMGTVTLAAAYNVTATAPYATPPANGFNRWILFKNIGTQAAPIWIELTRGTADVAN
jgi:hypothetical protein